MEDTNKICTRCKHSFSISDFNWRVKKDNRRQSCCKYCQRLAQNTFYRNTPEYQNKVKASSRNRKKHIKQLYLAYLKKQQCMDCKISNPIVLTHDHRDPSEKKECISVMLQRGSGWKTLQDEIAKCDVVCFNCHAKRTAKTQKWYENW